VINVAKAIEPNTNKLPFEIIKEEIKSVAISEEKERKLNDLNVNVAVLAGGMIAEEVTSLQPIAADLACENVEVSQELKKILSSESFRIEISNDILGVQLAGVLKNILAIGAGFFGKFIDNLKKNTGNNKKKERKHFPLHHHHHHHHHHHLLLF